MDRSPWMPALRRYRPRVTAQDMRDSRNPLICPSSPTPNFGRAAIVVTVAALSAGGAKVRALAAPVRIRRLHS